MHTRILPRRIPRSIVAVLVWSLFTAVQHRAAATCRVDRTTFVLRRRSVPITNLAIQRRLAHVRRSIASERGQ